MAGTGSHVAEIAGICDQHGFHAAKVPWITIGSARVGHKSVLVRHTMDGRAPASGSGSARERESQQARSEVVGFVETLFRFG